MSTGLELIRAGAEHQSALGNLLELYIHDFSELAPLDVGDDDVTVTRAFLSFGPITLECHFWRNSTAN